MTIKDLQQLRPLFNLSELARRADINDRTLNAKVRRGTELTVVESEAIREALESYGLRYDRELLSEAA